jgi:hypothetical protein
MDIRKGREITGGWRKFHNDKFHNLYISNIIRMIKEDVVGKVCGAHRRNKNTQKNFNFKSSKKKNTWEIQA